MVNRVVPGLYPRSQFCSGWDLEAVKLRTEYLSVLELQSQSSSAGAWARNRFYYCTFTLNFYGESQILYYSGPAKPAYLPPQIPSSQVDNRNPFTYPLSASQLLVYRHTSIVDKETCHSSYV